MFVMIIAGVLLAMLIRFPLWYHDMYTNKLMVLTKNYTVVCQTGHLLLFTLWEVYNSRPHNSRMQHHAV